MYVSKRTAVALLTASALAGSAATGMTALAHDRGDGKGGARGEHGNRTVLITSLAPSVPSDPALLGSTAGSAPWVLRSGEAKLHSDGRLTARIRGLVIPTGTFAGTPGPVTAVSASLYCGGSSTPVGTSPSAPISRDGDARIATTLTLPAKCQIPALLIHPNGALGVYIATSGFGG